MFETGEPRGVPLTNSADSGSLSVVRDIRQNFYSHVPAAEEPIRWWADVGVSSVPGGGG